MISHTIVRTLACHVSTLNSGRSRGCFRHCLSAAGQTDEIGKKIVEQPVSVPDLHATIYAALGVDPSKELFEGNRPVPITDQGTPVRKLFVSPHS